MWSNDIPSIVYTKMKYTTKKKLDAAYPGKYDVKYTGRAWDRTDAHFPTVSFKKITGGEKGADMEGTSVNAIVSNIQIEVITNTSQSDADAISDVVMESMKEMRYQVVGDPYQDESDKTVYRIVARYKRSIADDDVI